jgi:hypothetical protein
MKPLRGKNHLLYQGDLFRGLGFRASGGGLVWLGGFGLASFLSVSGRGPLFSSRKRHFQKCQVWYNPEVWAKT